MDFELMELGQTEKLISAIVNNLHVKLNQVYIRYEDTKSPIDPTFSSAMILDSLDIYTCDKNWHRKFVQRDQTTNKMADIVGF